MSAEYAEAVVKALWWLVGVLGASVVGLGYLILHSRGERMRHMIERLDDLHRRVISLEEWRKNKFDVK